MPPLTIRLNPADNGVVSRADLLPGTEIAGESVKARVHVPVGHKIATTAIGAGEAVRKYGQILGFAIEGIAPGDHVHTHNMAMGDFARDYAFGQDARPTEPAGSPATFQGIVRADGRVATRNYLGVLTTVNCSAAWEDPLIAARFHREFGNGFGLTAYGDLGGFGVAAHVDWQLLGTHSTTP